VAEPEVQMEYLKERLKTHIELLKIWTALIVATTSGIVGLLFKLQNPLSLVLIGLGVWLDTFFIVAFARAWMEIKNTLKEMREWKKK